MLLENARFERQPSLRLRVVESTGTSYQARRYKPVPIRLFTVGPFTNSRPYPRDRIRRRSPDRPRLSVAPHLNHFYISAGGCLWRWLGPGELVRDAGRDPERDAGEEEGDKLCFDIIVHIPQEVIVEVTTLFIPRSEELCIRMYDLTHLHLDGIDMSSWFAGPEVREPHGFKDVLRGLRSTSSEPTNEFPGPSRSRW